MLRIVGLKSVHSNSQMLMSARFRVSLINNMAQRFNSVSTKVLPSDLQSDIRGQDGKKNCIQNKTSDKLKPPVPSSFEGSFQTEYERITKFALIPLTIVPFYASFTGVSLYPLLDGSISSLFLIYSHYGFTSLIIDYVPKKKYPKLHKTSLWSLYLASFLGMCGIYELETENNGVIDLIKRLWNYDERNLYVFGRSQ